MNKDAINDVTARANRIIRWIESAQETFRKNPRVFVDLEISGLEQGILFLKHRFIPEVKTNHEMPFVILVCGGTNTGKSTLVNSFSKKNLSPTGGGIASFTKRVIAVGKDSKIEKCFQARPEWNLRPFSQIDSPENPFFAIYQQGLPEWPESHPIFLDTPDIDSSDLTCRKHSLLALAFPDLVVWVTTQQKYKDRSGMTFLDEAMDFVKFRIDVFNQFLPRQQDAFDDLKEFYTNRWPENTAVAFKILENSRLGEEEWLGEAQLEELGNELKTAVEDKKVRKIENLRHGIKHLGRRMNDESQKILARKQECMSVRQELFSWFDEIMFIPIHRLDGHSQPFELQEALIRVLKPRLENVFSDAVNRVDVSVRNAASWVWNIVRGQQEFHQAPIDPIIHRDSRDLDALQKILENTRFSVLEKIRREGSTGNIIFSRLHSELRNYDWPDSIQSPEALKMHLESRYKEKLIPLIQKFEDDLVKFCEENPALINTLRATIPGISVLAALAAAIFSIHAFTILPGVSEYFLGGMAYPIFRQLHNLLPEKLLTLANQLSQRPFIQQARENFTRSRIAIFREMARWLSDPVLSLLSVSDLPDLDLALVLKRMERSWRKSLSTENSPPATDDLQAKGSADEQSR